MSKKLIFLDIDGTLLLTNRAGYDALYETMARRFGAKGKAYRYSHSLAGCTDAGIIKECISDIKGSCSSADAAGFMITYQQLLHEYIPTHNGRLMANVKETLEYLRSHRPDVRCCLLTGNTALGARYKVEHYGLFGFFDYAHSVYGDLSEQRSELAKIMYTRLLADSCVQSPQDVILIGDTVNDVACAEAIGARCIAVLDGSESSREDFLHAPVRAWKILERLPDNPAEFAGLIDEA